VLDLQVQLAADAPTTGNPSLYDRRRKVGLPEEIAMLGDEE
jgi:hypothetical protein